MYVRTRVQQSFAGDKGGGEVEWSDCLHQKSSVIQSGGCAVGLEGAKNPLIGSTYFSTSTNVKKQKFD